MDMRSSRPTTIAVSDGHTANLTHSPSPNPRTAVARSSLHRAAQSSANSIVDEVLLYEFMIITCAWGDSL